MPSKNKTLDCPRNLKHPTLSDWFGKPRPNEFYGR